jgi:hypothetical protein
LKLALASNPVIDVFKDAEFLPFYMTFLLQLGDTNMTIPLLLAIKKTVQVLM